MVHGMAIDKEIRNGHPQDNFHPRVAWRGVASISSASFLIPLALCLLAFSLASFRPLHRLGHLWWAPSGRAAPPTALAFSALMPMREVIVVLLSTMQHTNDLEAEHLQHNASNFGNISLPHSTYLYCVIYLENMQETKMQQARISRPPTPTSSNSAYWIPS
jgi:hypothetical protein